MSNEVICTNNQSVKPIWHLYIVETRYHHWYTGITTDVARRFSQHDSGKGAKALVGKGPLSLIFNMPVGTRSEASKLEYQVQKLSKLQKVNWVKRCLADAHLHPTQKSL